MSSATAMLQGEHGDDAQAARSALEALELAARQVAAQAGAGSAAMLAGALVRLAEATAAAEELACRQITVAAIGRARRPASGAWRGLRSV